MGVTGILFIFRLVYEGKTGTEPQKQIPDAEDNTSRPLTRRFMVDLSSLRTLLAVFQKSQEPSFGKW